MSNLLSNAVSIHREIQDVLSQLNNGKGFNLSYSEWNLCIDLPKLTTKSEEEFFKTIATLEAIEADINAKYDILRSFVKEGEITLEPALTLKLNLLD
ncbi:MAG: hypothetical protein H6850_04205 [Alphaproteobacteria bacterium]|nr:MAG: hypothetical protein H6850_04205 [Alphaproteobacteria bacterium]